MDEDISLPEDTLSILQEFLKEKRDREIKEQSTEEFIFEENWNLSQFWYNQKTITDISCALSKICDETDEVALLSCPSLYKDCKQIHSNTKIFEYDNRFEVWSDFIKYDYNLADNNYLEEYHNYFDFIIVDPPFLSKECIDKISIIVKKICKNNAKILFCSGQIVEQWLKENLALHKCLYTPNHTRNLGNEFATFSNFDFDPFCGNMN